MEILKIKDWVKSRESGAQFDVIRKVDGRIWIVRRISDGKYFTCYSYVKQGGSTVRILGFLDDLIHINFTIVHKGASEGRIYTEQIEEIKKWNDFNLGIFY